MIYVTAGLTAHELMKLQSLLELEKGAVLCELSQSVDSMD